MDYENLLYYVVTRYTAGDAKGFLGWGVYKDRAEFCRKLQQLLGAGQEDVVAEGVNLDAVKRMLSEQERLDNAPPWYLDNLKELFDSIERLKTTVEHAGAARKELEAIKAAHIAGNFGAVFSGRQNPATFGPTPEFEN